MKTLLSLALASLWNRRLSVALTVLSLVISVTLLLGVEQLRQQAQASFTRTIAGTDLIVGARASPIQLLLYSVFHIGGATNEITWETYRAIAGHEQIAWTVPLALGDSHRGFRVIGTERSFFEHYRYGLDRPLRFQTGRAFADVYEAVVGARVARDLGYASGASIVVSHGLSRHALQDHGDKPFTVVGLLEPTGTPLDRSVLISLAGIEAIHLDWREGRPPTPGERISADAARAADLTPATITAFLVGLQSRFATFEVQRMINNHPREPLTAILPGVALGQLWQVVGTVETVLLAISAMVVLAGLLGMVTALLTSLNERRREMAILRAVGARPRFIFGLFVLEGGVIGVSASLIGLLLVQALVLLAQAPIAAWLGVYLTPAVPGQTEWLLLGLVVLATLLASLLPAWRAYRQSLADGLNVHM